MKAIYLTGFMGCGKTTVGKLLGEAMRLPVIDMDEEIVRHTGKSIPQIFSEQGEEGFRTIETKCLKLLPTKDVIITTGGGIVIKEENRKWMKDNGITLFLHCEFDILYKRIEQDENRPLANNNSKLEVWNLYKKREPLYKEAHHTIKTSSLSPNEVAEKVLECLKNGHLENI